MKTMDIFFQGFDFRTVIVEGGAPGADLMAKKLALKYKLRWEEYKADWKTYGKAAGPIRNKRMLDEGKPHMVMAFHNDLSKSKGTKDMVEQAEKRGIPVMKIKSSEIIQDKKGTEGK